MQFIFSQIAEDVNTRTFATDIINSRHRQALLNRAETMAVNTYF